MKEQAQHGTAQFPLGWYPHMNSSWQGYFFVPHWHAELELIIIESGTMELVVQGKSYILLAGEIALIPPNVLHTAYRLQERACTFSCVVFVPKFIASASADELQTELLQPLFSDGVGPLRLEKSAGDFELKRELDLLMMALDGQKYYDHLRAKGLLLQILAILFADKEDWVKSSVPSELRSRREKLILQFLEIHYAEKLTLADLAKVLKLSKEQFSRFFRQSFRRSPFQYLIQFRLQKACQLLISGDHTVTEIAEACGFESSNYFARVFKEHFNLSPTEFRQK
ncbi:AraC family transcriptional regulator [Lapidilactobacillus bayanensis]|uniref:AraC family transcriptional regulator n=1 Tax=Lapidilactobacillus bayanensis TaxID=2485998 RepID=UPI000F7A86C8|nr:AraC family transcriptional regulator [Lapidilactobacillus bayanensis]